MQGKAFPPQCNDLHELHTVHISWLGTNARQHSGPSCIRVVHLMASNCGINEEISRGRAFWMPQIPISSSLDDLISMERKALCPQEALHKLMRCLICFVQQYLQILH